MVREEGRAGLMSRIDPRFGRDFRPGLRDLHKTPTLQLVYDADRDAFDDDVDDLEYEQKRAVRGVVCGALISMAAWAITIAIIALLIWGVG
jgi:hypothetical protein